MEESAAPPSTANMLAQLADTIDELADGPAGGNAVERDVRRRRGSAGHAPLVEMKPVLDNSTINRAVPALNALDAAIASVRRASIPT